MIHIYKKGQTDNTLLLLHGTGGSEEDLLDIGQIIDINANILSVRGMVLENHMSRFFKRIKEGVFDIEDLIFRTYELSSFIDEASVKYGFNREKVIAIGYSNGANIAANMLFQIPSSLKGAILLRPMVPRRGIELPDLSDVNVFIAAGLYDNICPAKESKELNEMLVNSKANVNLEWVESTHRLTYQELEKAKDWYENIFK